MTTKLLWNNTQEQTKRLTCPQPDNETKLCSMYRGCTAAIVEGHYNALHYTAEVSHGPQSQQNPWHSKAVFLHFEPIFRWKRSVLPRACRVQTALGPIYIMTFRLYLYTPSHCPPDWHKTLASHPAARLTYNTAHCPNYTTLSFKRHTKQNPNLQPYCSYSEQNPLLTHFVSSCLLWGQKLNMITGI